MSMSHKTLTPLLEVLPARTKIYLIFELPDEINDIKSIMIE